MEKMASTKSQINILQQTRRTLVKPRRYDWKVWTFVTGISLILYGITISQTSYNIFYTAMIHFNVLTFFLIILEVVHRIFFSFEERQYLLSRYDDNKTVFLENLLYRSNGLNTVLAFYLLTKFILLFNNICIVYKYEQNPYFIWYNFGPFPVLLSLLGGFILGRILKLNNGPWNESLWIANSNGLDYGSGMAHSFFHGYLKLIIPKSELNPDLKQLMEYYETKEQVKLECYKLFILIPKSMYCPPNLMNNLTSPSIEESKSLVDKNIDVAGVKNRSYKNSVYKIRKNNGKKAYVVAEYATPLKTFGDVITEEGNAHYKIHKNDIAYQFYSTLKGILKQHPDCGKYCDIIYYNDKKEAKDGNIEYYDVGEILLKRVENIKKKEKTS